MTALLRGVQDLTYAPLANVSKATDRSSLSSGLSPAIS